jgi:acetoin utilization deacetylase AcuC-like enzyme
MLKIAWSSRYAHDLPEGHRFPMEKYNLLPEQLLYEGTITPENIFEPGILDQRWVLKTHQESYWDRLKSLSLSKSEIRAIGFPLSEELVVRELNILQGSVEASLYALQFGIGMNIAGGTHHAFTDKGEGFCLLNDIAVTANFLIQNKLSNKVLVIDLDVHQGNGTAEIFKGREDVFTFSMHGEKNYPHRKENSHLDIPLPDQTKDDFYLKQLSVGFEKILKIFTPDFIIYQCGVDVLATDQLGRMNLTIQGLKQRDRIVLNLAKELGVPIMCCMGGGYSKQIKNIIDGHAQVFRLAQEIFF